MFEFTLFRIPIRVEPFHWVILAILGSAGNGLESRKDLIDVLLFMVAGFFSIVIHEMGHALVGRKYGAPNPQIILHGMGGVALFPGARFNRKENFLVTAAGPGIQILFGLIALAGIFFAQLPPGVIDFVSIFMTISLFWAILNLLPVWPLDGGQMLGAIIGPQRAPLLHKISIGIAIFVGVAGLLSGFMLFFSIILGFMAYQNWQQLQQYGSR